MLKLVHAIAALAMVAGFSAPSIAQEQPAAPAASPPAVKAPIVDLNQVICQKQEITGSRLGTKRVCKTRREWADGQFQDRQEIERVQVQRGIVN